VKGCQLILVPALLLTLAGCHGRTVDPAQQNGPALVDVTALRSCAQIMGAMEEAGTPKVPCLEVSVDARGGVSARPASVSRSCRSMAFPSAYGHAKCSKRMYSISKLTAVADRRYGGHIVGCGQWLNTPEALAKSLRDGTVPGMSEVERISASGEVPADTVIKLMVVAMDNLARVELRIVTEAKESEAGRLVDKGLREGLAKAKTALVLLRVDRSASWGAVQRVLAACVNAKVRRLAIVVVRDGRAVVLGRPEGPEETNALALVPAEWAEPDPTDAVSDIPLGQPPPPPAPRPRIIDPMRGE
jgi:hypothetical protein